MAITPTDVTVEPTFFGLTNLPEQVTQRSAIPRQEMFFNSFSDAIDVEAGGDSQLLRYIFNLPIGFAYAVVELYYSVVGTDAGDWGDTAIQSIRDAVQDADTNYRIHMESLPSFEVETTAGVCFRSYHFTDLPSRLFLPKAGGSVWQMAVANDTINGSAMTANISARFLVYDIAQAHDFEVNTPQLVR